MTAIIIGLGKTGLSCIKFLNALGYPLIVVDTRAAPPELKQFQVDYPHIPYYLGDDIPTDILLSAQMIVLSPGIARDLPILQACDQKKIPIIGDIELFARHAKSPTIAITGTNGKSTVTTLAGELLSAAGYRVLVGGNLGTPALDLLEQPQPDFYVLELSSFQLDLTHSLKAKVAVLLNITPDHLDRHKTFSNYILSKQRIYRGCDIAVYNRNDPTTTPSQSAQSISFALDEPHADQFGIRYQGTEPYLAFGSHDLLPAKQLRLIGQHNWQNALASLAIAKACGADLQQVLPALQQFPGLPHRCQWVAEVNNVTWYNDSKGTNVGATCAALEGLGPMLRGKIVLIAGGQGKNASFEPLRDMAQPYVRHAILIGQDAHLIAQALQGTIAFQHATDLKHAVILAKSVAQPGDAVLLSPACASFDSFKDFEHRGMVFTQFVKGLVENA